MVVVFPQPANQLVNCNCVFFTIKPYESYPESDYVAAGCRPAGVTWISCWRWNNRDSHSLMHHVVYTLVCVCVCVCRSAWKRCSDSAFLMRLTRLWTILHGNSCFDKTSDSFVSSITAAEFTFLQMTCMCMSGRGLARWFVRYFHSGETYQEDLLQTQTLSWEVDQPFVWPTHPACPFGQVIWTISFHLLHRCSFIFDKLSHFYQQQLNPLLSFK